VGELFRLVLNAGAGSRGRTITVEEALGISAVATDGTFQPLSWRSMAARRFCTR